ncbi:hypothetical protein [Sphingobacterium griseoflavum]|uniref:Uncharacterized protein n=1 Tax=Sphingobacterium griseoflavum TaxID=1474952 RepID=A0ABQ3HYK9_9SPHI|nr:hypothetical protein [Sphingobacterium griseoflavum]GHE37048.1 hypothetical protein GCM10017764_20330 [Sphingobacterium griseoflavum]
MKGLITKRNGRDYRIPCAVVLCIAAPRDGFILEGGGYIHSRQKLEENIEYEFELVEIDRPSEMLSQDNDFSEVDFEHEKLIEGDDYQLRQDMQEFRRLEAILKEEGTI